MAYGMEAVAGGIDLLCLGDLGVGNSTVAAAILCMLYGGNGADWVGPGSGADAAMMRRKAEAVDAAVALHGSHRDDPFEILRRVGGREFAAMAGAIIAARAEKVPVILDGFGAQSLPQACCMRSILISSAIACWRSGRPIRAWRERRKGWGSNRCSISGWRMARASARRSPLAL